MYFLVDCGKIVEEFYESDLINLANEEIAEEMDGVGYPAHKDYPDLDLDEAIEYFQEQRGYDIIKGNYI